MNTFAAVCLPPYFFLLVCSALYFHFRSKEVFSQNHPLSSYASIFSVPCAEERRRGMMALFLRELPTDVNGLSFLLLVYALRQGGAGSLVWYLLFSLLWLKPRGILATLWNYYRGEGETELDLQRMAERAAARRGLRLPRSLAFALMFVQISALIALLLALFFLFLGGGRSLFPLEPFQPLWLLPCALSLFFGLSKASLRERFTFLFSLAFFLFLGTSLIVNLFNVIPVLKIIVLDAFRASRFILGLSAAGLRQAALTGLRLSSASFVTQGLNSSESERDRFPQAVFLAIYTQIKSLLMLLVHLLLAVLYLCALIVPQDNQLVMQFLYAFIAALSVLFVLRVCRSLFFLLRKRKARVSAVLAFFLTLAVFYRLDSYLSAAMVFFHLASLFLLFFLLYDANCFFILLEDYRDCYLWHREPYPKISRHEPRRDI